MCGSEIPSRFKPTPIPIPAPASHYDDRPGSLGLLPAALSTGIGSDTQKPFAIVIVAGLISRLFIGFFVNPVPASVGLSLRPSR